VRGAWGKGKEGRTFWAIIDDGLIDMRTTDSTPRAHDHHSALHGTRTDAQGTDACEGRGCGGGGGGDGGGGGSKKHFRQLSSYINSAHTTKKAQMHRVRDRAQPTQVEPTHTRTAHAK
jgi:hypothetical protein